MSIRLREWTTAKGEAKSAWVCDYFDAGGKRRLKSFRLKKEALAFAAGATVEVKQGVHVADSASVTIAKTCELWLEKASADKLETSTLRDYARTVRLHIAPYLGALKLTTLTVPRLRAFEDDLRAAGRTDFTIRRTVLTLGIAIADGQERGLVARNVVRDVRARRGSGDKRQEKRAKGKLKVGVDVPTREDVKALLAVAPPRWRPLVVVAAFCGLRASELRGLRWVDVDFDRGAIHVRQRADAFNDIGRPKSETSERTVPAPPLVLNALREWKLACPKGQLSLVFPNTRGNPEALSNILRRGLHPAWAAAGVTRETGELDSQGQPVHAPRYTGLHCLRHFYASWCANRRVDGGLELPLKIVSDRMGHSSILLTQSTYAHLFPSSDDGSELAEASAWFSSTAT